MITNSIQKRGCSVIVSKYVRFWRIREHFKSVSCVKMSLNRYYSTFDRTPGGYGMAQVVAGLVPFIFPSNKWTLHPKKFFKAKRAKKFREFCQNPVFCGTRSCKHAQKVLKFEYDIFLTYKCNRAKRGQRTTHKTKGVYIIYNIFRY